MAPATAWPAAKGGSCRLKSAPMWDTPATAGTRTVRVEVFVDDPDSFIARAVAAGADGSVDEIRDHQRPWGVHRQGGFTDPFGHLWLVGDRAPLSTHKS